MDNQRQSRSIQNGQWLGRVRPESVVTLDLESHSGFLFDGGNKSFLNVATMTLLADEALEWGTSDNPRLRLAVAANCSASEEILHELARDGHFEIRAMVASNTSASLDTAYLLTNDDVPFVSTCAARRFNLSSEQQVADHRIVVRLTFT
jgi:hypothetical protein